jgi:hypothetical protein
VREPEDAGADAVYVEDRETVEELSVGRRWGIPSARAKAD